MLKKPHLNLFQSSGALYDKFNDNCVKLNNEKLVYNSIFNKELYNNDENINANGPQNIVLSTNVLVDPQSDSETVTDTNKSVDSLDNLVERVKNGQDYSFQFENKDCNLLSKHNIYNQFSEKQIDSKIGDCKGCVQPADIEDTKVSELKDCNTVNVLSDVIIGKKPDTKNTTQKDCNIQSDLVCSVNTTKVTFQGAAEALVEKITTSDTLILSEADKSEKQELSVPVKKKLIPLPISVPKYKPSSAVLKTPYSQKAQSEAHISNTAATTTNSSTNHHNHHHSGNSISVSATFRVSVLQCRKCGATFLEVRTC